MQLCRAAGQLAIAGNEHSKEQRRLLGVNPVAHTTYV